MAGVLDDVLSKCREALLSGTPVLYIKTDSDIFINKLVMSDLVVLLSTGGAAENLKELKILRPLRELEDSKDKWLKLCVNYSEGVPSKDDKTGCYNLSYHGYYQELHDDAPEYDNGKYLVPHLWVQKIDLDSNNNNSFKALREYILDRNDINHPQYEALQSSAVIIYSSQVILPEYLTPYTEFIDVNYPDESEIKSIIAAAGGDDFAPEIANLMLGFTLEEAESIVSRIQSFNDFNDLSYVKKIIRERKSLKMQGGLLEQCEADGNIGGMENFRRWLDQQAEPLKNAAAYMKSRGTPPPKGVLLCGVPGCGKSEAAKFAALTLKLPLLKMDVGSLMDKHLGVAEQRMRGALKIAEAMSPCVLWIDELEKGFSGAGSDESTPSFKRMFAYMLGWMQDNKSPCFIFATANNIGGLPKEFFRSGRFSALYAVYLPTRSECADIFTACMDKAERNAAKARGLKDYSVRLFAAGCRNPELFYKLIDNKFVKADNTPRILIGSDIQNLVNIALRELSAAGRDGDIIAAANWESMLNGILDDREHKYLFSVYGDSPENIESIAVSYCRMLRKGFTPVSGNILFKAEEYHAERAELKDGEQDAAKILDKIKPEIYDNLCLYDKAVYDCLSEKINKFAEQIEKREHEILIKS